MFVNVLCMKWGTAYGPDYVNRLYAQVRKHLSLPHRFVCLTDNPFGLNPEIETFPIPNLQIPGRRACSTWQKLGVFSNQEHDLVGPTLFLDLDLLICGSLDCFFEYEPKKIAIIHNWISDWKTVFRKRPDIGNSSVFRFPAGECHYIIERFQREKEVAVAQFWPPQTYLTECIRDRMVFWPEQWVKSFKFHCRPSFPTNLIRTPRRPESIGTPNIVVFHGKPNPHQALVGFSGSKWSHVIRPTPWIGEYWSE